MKDLTDSELLEVVDGAMKAVAERFKEKRESADATRQVLPPAPREQRPAA